MKPSSPHPPLHARGHTLIELLAALTLAAIVACAVLALCRGLMRQAKAGQPPMPAFEIRLRETLADEVAEAEQVERIPQGFALTGPIRPKPDLASEGHRPLRVEWRVDQDRLIREETDLLTGAKLRQTAAAGIERAELVMQGDRGQVSVAGAALRAPIVLTIEGKGR